MKLKGNIISGQTAGYGEIATDGNLIVSIKYSGEIQPDADWIVPGFIDTHIHGIGDGEAIGDGIGIMAKFAPETGMTGFLPTLATSSEESTLQYLQTVRDNMRELDGSRILGAHLEGPFLELAHRGGMDRAQLRTPDAGEVKAWLECAAGVLKIVTIAPELAGADTVIRMLHDSGIAVSLGHTGMGAEALPAAVDSGISRVCHLFDAYEGRPVDSGVSQVALADAVLTDDRLMIELICDGFHVPSGLVRLAVRAAGVERIVAISDAMPGTGKPDGIYAEPDGRLYKLENAGVCRFVEPPHEITGSCLTMNRAFANLIFKFGFSPVEAALMTSCNPARSIGLGDIYGMLTPGYTADIVVLANDLTTVKETIINGKKMLG
ncbi:MAG: N-acetylglucosamine-6-phosphate deacetylase [Lentisphaerae bacterium]|nr:N-acetylglucosamine-6-phosphate deacetylase [Lentisphaerota bacterium]